MLTKLDAYFLQYLHKEEKSENIIKDFWQLNTKDFNAKYASYIDKKHKHLSIILCLIFVLPLSRHIIVQR